MPAIFWLSNFSLRTCAEECCQDAVGERRGINEVDREIVACRPARQEHLAPVRHARSRALEVRMEPSRPTRAGAADVPRGSIGRQPENFKQVVHGRPRQALPGAERHVKLSSRVLIEPVEVHRAVALVAQDLDQRGTTFFGGWLQLPVGNPQEVHLKGLDEKIL